MREKGLDSSDTPHLTYFVATDLTKLDGVVFYVRGVAGGVGELPPGGVGAA